MRWVHLHRFAAAKKSVELAAIEVLSRDEVAFKGARYDLRTRKKTGKIPGFLIAPDGAHLRWTHSVLEHCAPGAAPVAMPWLSCGPLIARVGSRIVGSAEASRPWIVVSTHTGEIEGALDEQQPIDFGPRKLFTPTVVRADHSSLWLNEQTRLARYDVATRRCCEAIAAPDGAAWLHASITASGNVVAIVRPSENVASCERAGDVVASFSPNGIERWRRDLRPMHLAALGDNCVLVDDSARSFVVLSDQGDELQRVPMFEPSKIPWATVIALPSRDEWLSIGNHGEWDHYGPASLAGASS